MLFPVARGDQKRADSARSVVCAGQTVKEGIMSLLNEETVLKIKSLPPEEQQQVLDGIARLLSERASAHSTNLQANDQVDDKSESHPHC